MSMFVYALIFVCIGRNVTVPFSDLVFEQITVTHAETVESYGSTKIWFDYYIYAKDDRIFIIDDYYAAHGLTGFFSAFKKEEFQESLTGNDIIDVAFIEENGKLKVYEVYKNGIAYMTYQDCVRVNNRQNGSRIITIMALLFISIIILVKKVLWPKKRE